MQDKTEQAVDEFLNSKPSLDGCIAVWEQLSVEVQNGDPDVAISQARRVALLTRVLMTINGLVPAAYTLSALADTFRPALIERGMLGDDNAN